MNKTKRILAMLLALTMLLCAAACTASEDDDKNSKREKRTEEIKEENEFEADEQIFDFEEYGEATGVHRDLDEAIDLYIEAINNKDMKTVYELTVPTDDMKAAAMRTYDLIEDTHKEYGENANVGARFMFADGPVDYSYSKYANKVEGTVTETLRLMCCINLGEFLVEAYNLEEYGWRFVRVS